MTSLRVFVSYASTITDEQESLLAQQLIKDLREAGIEVVADETVVPEAQFLAFLQRELPTCRWFIFIQTAESQSSLRTQVAMNSALQQVQQGTIQGVLRIVCPSAAVEHAPASWSEAPAYLFNGNYPRMRDRLFLDFDTFQIQNTLKLQYDTIYMGESTVALPSVEGKPLPHSPQSDVPVSPGSFRLNSREVVVSGDRPLPQNKLSLASAVLAHLRDRKHGTLRSSFLLSLLAMMLIFVIVSVTVFAYQSSTPGKSPSTARRTPTQITISAKPTATQALPTQPPDPGMSGKNVVTQFAHVQNQHTPSRCLDADTNTIANNGTKVQLWDCNGSAQQGWVFFSYGNGTFQIQSQHAPYRCLDADTNTMANNGTKMQLWDCNGSVQQTWAIFSYGNGTFELQNQHAPYRCLDADTNTMANNGTKMQLWDCNGSSQQTWG